MCPDGGSVPGTGARLRRSSSDSTVYKLALASHSTFLNFLLCGVGIIIALLYRIDG